MRTLKILTILHGVVVAVSLMAAVAAADADVTVHCNEGGAASCIADGRYCSCDGDSIGGCVASCSSTGDYQHGPCGG
jgi:hypothetical protein